MDSINTLHDMLNNMKDLIFEFRVQCGWWPAIFWSVQNQKA